MWALTFAMPKVLDSNWQKPQIFCLTRGLLGELCLEIREVP